MGEIEKNMGVKVILMDAPAFKVGDVTMEMASCSLGKVYLMDLMNLASSSSVDEAMCKIVGEMVGNMCFVNTITQPCTHQVCGVSGISMP